MKILKLVITNDERNLAVQEYLSRRGVMVNVTNVTDYYGTERGQQVECEERPVAVPVYRPTPEEALTPLMSELNALDAQLRAEVPNA